MEHQKSSEICPDSIPKLWIDPQIHRLMWWSKDQRRMLAAITAADAAGFTCSEAPFWTWDMVGCGGMWWDMVGYGGIWIRIGADETNLKPHISSRLVALGFRQCSADLCITLWVTIFFTDAPSNLDILPSRWHSPESASDVWGPELVPALVNASHGQRTPSPAPAGAGQELQEAAHSADMYRHCWYCWHCWHRWEHGASEATLGDWQPGLHRKLEKRCTEAVSTCFSMEWKFYSVWSSTLEVALCRGTPILSWLKELVVD